MWNLQPELEPKTLEWAMCANCSGECSKDGPLGFYWFVKQKCAMEGLRQCGLFESNLLMWFSLGSDFFITNVWKSNNFPCLDYQNKI